MLQVWQKIPKNTANFFREYYFENFSQNFSIKNQKLFPKIASVSM